MDKYDFLSNTEITLIEQVYQQYKVDKSSVEDSWRAFFEGFEFAQTNFSDNEKGLVDNYDEETKVLSLINAYRERGHLFTKTNPVRSRRKYSPTLDIENFGLSNVDLAKEFNAGKEIGIGKSTLSNIIESLKTTYCNSIGIEFRYIRNVEMGKWLLHRMEEAKNTPRFSKEEKAVILNKLSEAVLFEKFLHRKFVGQKRFSLEGAETLIPGLHALISEGAAQGVCDVVIGMAHRGRLSVLTNIMQKSYRDVFIEFEGKEYDDEALMGDVKYHLGYSSIISKEGCEDLKLTLSPNPSHLEAVNPVVEGIAKARAKMYYNDDYSKILPILIHGDASIAGQGIVYEVIQMAELPGYKTGGTIHVVINNQIGFTTNYLDGRSSVYCTDVAKTIQAPIFHVNGDDVEALAYTMKLAMDFRQQFKKDVFIDLLCYRKYGHNEADEPRFTQPILYKLIEAHKNPLEIYAKQLLEEGLFTNNEIKEIENKINSRLDADLDESKTIKKAHITSFMEKEWEGIRKSRNCEIFAESDTMISMDILKKIGHQLTALPDGKMFFRKLIKLQEDRRAMIEKTGMLDWAMGELLAYGSLLEEGFPVRLSGQDVERGTFSHRHSVLTIEDSEEKYIPLNNISENQAKFEVYNSLLSEYGVLGFEYGYALTNPNKLVIWEAQFGDFFNGAQIIIDQFITCAEEKWNVMNGLVMLLPHGYEGMGSEHSSARMERFLILCADNNIQIANCTTPANFFHLLRRQLKREYRKPLVVFTPKSLLRHPLCMSPINEFTDGAFKEVIDDTTSNKEQISTILICIGKMYYDLLDQQKKLEATNYAIIRLEQIFPFPEYKLDTIISSYPNANDVIWVQEEPINMGAWTFINNTYRERPLRIIARPASGSPAVGSSVLHKLRFEKLMNKAFGRCTCKEKRDICQMGCIER